MEITITLETLQQYRNQMTQEQLERYADYLLRKQPSQPFTLDEIGELEKRKKNELSTRLKTLVISISIGSANILLDLLYFLRWVHRFSSLQ